MGETQSNPPQTHTPRRWNWSLWLTWMLAMFLSGLIGGDIAWQVAGFMTGYAGDVGGLAVFGMLLGAILGFVTGVAQSLILQRTLTLQGTPDGVPFRAGQWIVATILGTALGGGLGWALFALIGGYVGAGITWLVFGSVGSVGQWLVLRRYVGQAVWWVVANACSIEASWVLAEVLRMQWSEGILLAMLLYGASTGAVMVMLLRV